MGLSSKQFQILLFPKTEYQALICDGAVRSGKTSLMSISFVRWAMEEFQDHSFAICGKTVQSAERNLILPLLGVRYFPKNGYSLVWSRSLRCLTVTRGNRTNRFFVFGGKDESSYMLIQGITLAGVLLDEVALMPRSFVEQALARCSVDGAKFWFNCNPENPGHWFYREWVLQPEKHNALHLHFLMTDNPSLSAETLARYESLYSGVFYDRYIRGLWVVADGLIYPDQAAGRGIVPDEPREYVKYAISVDYGTRNPFSAGLWGLYKGVWYRFDEFYYSGRETKAPLTDEEYYAELEKLAGGRPVSEIVVDPSAASFITAIERHGAYRVKPAVNDVVDGIRNTAQAFREGKIAVSEKCSGAIEEFKSYRWDDEKNEDKPVKENDHAMDEIRYFVETVLPGSTFSFA